MNRALFATLITFAGIGLIWGFSIVGGPGYARMEKNDNIRFADLRTLAAHYRCAGYQQTNSDKAISPSYCSSRGTTPPDRRDPVTGEVYEYIQTGDNAFEICATFQAATGIASNNGPEGFIFEGHRGCLGYVRKSAEYTWRIR